jgi:hypothetical protein
MTTPSPNASSPPTESARYCRKCGYALRGLTTPRCPECGRGFDLANPRTTRRRPLRRWLRHVRRAGFTLLAFMLLLAAMWGWLYWGWRAEQQALAELKPGYAQTMEPRLPQWLDKEGNPYAKRLRDYTGSSGFILNRTIYLKIEGPTPGITSLNQLRHLEVLYLLGTQVNDLSALGDLKELRCLEIMGGDLSSLSVLGGLTKLSDLELGYLPKLKDYSELSKMTGLWKLVLSDTSISDLSPLIGLTNLQYLDIGRTKVTDLRPLAGLTKLENLSISGTLVRDLSPLYLLKSLRYLMVNQDMPTTETDAL